MSELTQITHWFRERMGAIFRQYVAPNDASAPQEPMNAAVPDFSFLLPHTALTFEEAALLALALMPYVQPEALDLFFLQNKALACPYTEFGGLRQGAARCGFLPTGQTAVFFVSAGRTDPWQARQEVVRILSSDHWFRTHNVLRCEGQAELEPFLNGRLVVSDELLARVYGTPYQAAFGASFPAKKSTTPLTWDDLVVPYALYEELQEVVAWQIHQHQIRAQWNLDRIVKPGYRCLFYGPPGTGKTLSAMLVGQRCAMDVYRVDLSMIVSKYIGETEKNMANVFDKAQHHRWILFFDEADALFSQRTQTQNANDRHANQEVAYLLERIEDFPGMVILATNLKDNIDEAFLRRFQSALYFPMPDRALRLRLWRGMLPAEWLAGDSEELLHHAAEYALTGGNMVNVVRSCAIKLHASSGSTLTLPLLRQAIRREQEKEGQIINL